MNHQDTQSPTLFNLLAREWNTGAPITSMLFNAGQTAVGYALDNGSVAVAEVADNDAPQERIHVSAENGRSTIQPRTKTANPLCMVDVADGEQLLFGTIGNTDFVAGGKDGPLYRISTDGSKTPLGLELDAAVAAIGHCPATGRFAGVSGTRISVFEPDTTTPAWRFDHGEPVNALALAPDGHSIAVADDYGLAVWPMIDVPQKTIDIAFPGRPTALHWHPGGDWIACPLTDGGFQLSCVKDGRTCALTDYPAPVNAIDWNEQANALVTSGAFRVAAWSMDNPPISDATTGVLETGRAGLVAVSAVACNPRRNLVAAGYENGFIAIMQVGGRDEMVLNSEDHGAVTGIAWSRDGKSIAVATGRQSAAIVALPPQMFK